MAEIPKYGTKIYYNGEYAGHVYWGPKHDYVERIEVEAEVGTGKLQKLALLGKNDEKITLNIVNNKTASVDFEKADGRKFHHDIPA